MQEFHPPHIYERDTWYFITASTVGHQRCFDTGEKRRLLRDVLKQSVEACGVRLCAWVILSHRFIKRLHGHGAIQVNKMDSTPGRKVWYQYWD